MENNLREEVTCAFSDCRKALQDIEKNRLLLEHNGQLLRNSIQIEFARQIEALRQRKQWLISQSVLLREESANAIQYQEMLIKHAMIQLEKSLTELDQLGAENLEMTLVVNERLRNNLKHLSRLLESLSIPPILNFSFDSACLQNVIGQYGRILPTYDVKMSEEMSSFQPTSLANSVIGCCQGGNTSTFGCQLRRSCCTKEKDFLGVSNSEPNMTRHWLKNVQKKSDLSTNEITDSLSRTRTCSFEVMSNSDSSLQNDWCILKKDCNSPILPEKVELFTETNPQPDKQCDFEYFDVVKASNMNDWLQTTSDPSRLTSHVAEKHFSQVFAAKLGLVDQEEKDMDCSEIVSEVCCNYKSDKKGCCKSFFECKGDVNCGKRLLNGNRPEWNEWLLTSSIVPPLQEEEQSQYLKSKSSTKCLLDEMDRIMMSDQEEWLKRSSTQENMLQNYFESLNMTEDALEMSKWLLKTSSYEAEFPTKVNEFVDEQDHMEKWLTPQKPVV